MSHPPDLELLYSLDDWPPPGSSILFGMQWLALMLPLVMIPASVLSYGFNLSPGQQVDYLQRIILLTGIGTFIQAVLGNRLALVSGPAAVLMVGYLAAGGRSIYSFSGAIILGGSLLLVLGASGWLKRLMRLFTPNVVAAILILVAISLIPVVTGMAAGIDSEHPHGQTLVFFRAVALAMIIIFMSRYLPGIFRPLAIFIGIIIGMILNALTGNISLDHSLEHQWVSFPAFAAINLDDWSPRILLPFFFCYVALAVNEIGSVQGMGKLLEIKDLDKRQDRSFIFEGIINIASGLMGTIGAVSYSLSPGMVSVTKVASRYMTAIGAAILFLIGFSPKAANLLNLIPADVSASALLAILGTQIGAGVAILFRKAQMTGRDFMVVGFPVILGGITAFLPVDFFSGLPVYLHGLLSNSMVTGVIAVLILEHGLRPQKSSE